MQESAEEAFSQGRTYAEATAHWEMIKSKKLVRTQDIRQMLPKNSVMGKLEDLVKESVSQGYSFEWDAYDQYPSQIMKDDPLLCYFKYNRKTNYKRGMNVRSLGVFEDEQVYQ